MIVRNGLLYGPDSGWYRKDLSLSGRYIADGPADEDETLDADGCYVVPGLIDLHFHGCGGADFCDGTETALKQMAAFQLSRGVTTMVPASMSLPLPLLSRLFSTAASFMRRQQDSRTDAFRMASMAGINMEGPYLAPGKCGAHRADYLCSPSMEEFRLLRTASGGLIRLITIAPELPGAMDFIREFRDTLRISLGHTCASYDIASRAFRSGACHVTHLYNAMPPFSHRENGLIGAAFDSSSVTAELICDGVHVSPTAVRAAFSMFGPERIVLISDSMRAAGLRDGTWDLGGQQVTVSGNQARLADGTIAGSVTCLFDCVRTAVSAGIPVSDAFRCASENPARCLGLYDRVGSLEPGKLADLLVVGPDFTLRHVIHLGFLIF